MTSGLVEMTSGLGMDGDAGDIGEQMFVQSLDVVMMGDVGVEDGHLATANTGADVAHTVVIADGLMLIIRITLAGLRGEPHNLIPI